MNQQFKGSNELCFKSIAFSEHGKEILENIVHQVLRKKVEILKLINSENTENIENQRIIAIAKVDDITTNITITTNSYNYLNFFSNFIYLNSLFEGYNKKDINSVTNIIEINLNFGKSDIDTNELIIENRFGNSKGYTIENLASYDCFIDNIKKFCNDTDQYKYLLMLDMTWEELKDFYPNDKIVREYNNALKEYIQDSAIYYYSKDQEEEIFHNTEIKLAYAEGIKQEKIENARKMKEKGIEISLIKDITGLSEEEIAKL